LLHRHASPKYLLHSLCLFSRSPMRPDIENKVNDIKRSLNLLRRHL
jgi:hypothetical protein